VIIKWLGSSKRQKTAQDDGRLARLLQLSSDLGQSTSPSRPPPEESIPRDSDGQPIGRGYNESRRLDRATNELIGFVKGILANGPIDESKIEALAKWLLKNRELQQVWPVNVITERVAHVLRNGITDEQERVELNDILEKVVGPEPDRFLESRTATRLPLTDPPPTVVFAGRLFVLTGKFLYGTRKACETEIISRGGEC
jgi:hypothetical protein